MHGSVLSGSRRIVIAVVGDHFERRASRIVIVIRASHAEIDVKYVTAPVDADYSAVASARIYRRTRGARGIYPYRGRGAFYVTEVDADNSADYASDKGDSIVAGVARHAYVSDYTGIVSGYAARAEQIYIRFGGLFEVSRSARSRACGIYRSVLGKRKIAVAHKPALPYRADHAAYCDTVDVRTERGIDRDGIRYSALLAPSVCGRISRYRSGDAAGADRRHHSYFFGVSAGFGIGSGYVLRTRSNVCVKPYLTDYAACAADKSARFVVTCTGTRRYSQTAYGYVDKLGFVVPVRTYIARDTAYVIVARYRRAKRSENDGNVSYRGIDRFSY